MKIAVAGAGAVGGYIGACLQKAGNDVVFLARGEHLTAMKEKGLTIKDNGAGFRVGGPFTNDVARFADAELVLFSVKSTDTKTVAEKMATYLNERAVILTLQNGVDNEETLAGIFGEKRVLSAATYMQAQIETPGVIRNEGKAQLVIGALHNALTVYAEKVVDLFQTAGIEAKVKENIMDSKWKKLLWNATFNPLAALSMATIGDILDDDELRKTAEGVCREVMVIAEKNGTPLKEKMFEITFSNAELARHHQPSMLQDRLNEKNMEVESLAGYFVKKGRELGVATPYMQALYSTLRYIDDNR